MTEPTKKFRSAIIGAGLICPFHIAGIRRSGLADVVALCDTNLPQARQVAEQYRIPHVVEQVADLRELELDVIHVATPPNSHFALAKPARTMANINATNIPFFIYLQGLFALKIFFSSIINYIFQITNIYKKILSHQIIK